jgi:hypothetical protein
MTQHNTTPHHTGSGNSMRAMAWSSATNAVAVGSADSSFLVLHTSDAWKSWSTIIVRFCSVLWNYMGYCVMEYDKMGHYSMML